MRFDPKTKRPLPRTPAQWLKEIKLAIGDARGVEPVGSLVGTPITDANLFHLAPLVCLKFRGRELKGSEAKRVTAVAVYFYWRTIMKSRFPLMGILGLAGFLHAANAQEKKTPEVCPTTTIGISTFR